MAMTDTQLQQTASYWALQNFVSQNATATYSITDLKAAAQALDNAFDTTLATAVAAVGGGTTIINGLAQIIPAPFSGSSAQQKTLLCCYVLMKRAGII